MELLGFYVNTASFWTNCLKGEETIFLHNRFGSLVLSVLVVSLLVVLIVFESDLTRCKPLSLKSECRAKKQMDHEAQCSNAAPNRRTKWFLSVDSLSRSVQRATTSGQQ